MKWGWHDYFSSTTYSRTCVVHKQSEAIQHGSSVVLGLYSLQLLKGICMFKFVFAIASHDTCTYINHSTDPVFEEQRRANGSVDQQGTSIVSVIL